MKTGTNKLLLFINVQLNLIAIQPKTSTVVDFILKNVTDVEQKTKHHGQQNCPLEVKL